MASRSKAQCVILAGGLATRMRPLTDALPKALLPVGGIPFLDFQLRYLARHGVGEVVLTLGYKGEMIRDFAGAGEKWGLKIRYTEEGDKLLGTGGALRLAYDQNLLADRFLVLYGDSFLPVDFGEIWRGFHGAPQPAFMTIFRNQGQWDKSNVCFERGELIYDKNPTPALAARMKFIDYGLMGFSKQLIAEGLQPSVKTDLSVLMRNLIGQRKMLAVEVTERFYEIGSPEGLREFEEFSKTL